MIEKIIGIVAAPDGLSAVFKREDAERCEPVATLALVEASDGSRAIFSCVIDPQYPGLFIEASHRCGFVRFEWRRNHCPCSTNAV